MNLKILGSHGRCRLRVFREMLSYSVHLVRPVTAALSEAESSLLAVVPPLQLRLHKEVEYALQCS